MFRDKKEEAEYKVTIAIPTIDRIGLLREALQSVRLQTYKNFEVVLSDNAADERCARELKALVAEFDDLEIHVFHQKDQLSASKHAAFMTEAGSAPLWLYLPDDDLLEPKCLERFVGVLKNNPEAGLVFSDHHIIWEDGSLNNNTDSSSALYGRKDLQEGMLRAGDLYHYALLQTIPLQASLYRRDILQKLNFESVHPRVPDFELLFRLHQISPEVRVAYCKDRLVAYRIHGAQFTHNEKTLLIHQANVEILKRYPPTEERFRTAYEKKLQDALLVMSFAQAVQGERLEANQALLEALKINPREVKVWARAIAHQLPKNMLSTLQEAVSDKRGSTGILRARRLANRLARKMTNQKSSARKLGAS